MSSSVIKPNAVVVPYSTWALPILFVFQVMTLVDAAGNEEISENSKGPAVDDVTGVGVVSVVGEGEKVGVGEGVEEEVGEGVGDGEGEGVGEGVGEGEAPADNVFAQIGPKNADSLATASRAFAR